MSSKRNNFYKKSRFLAAFVFLSIMLSPLYNTLVRADDIVSRSIAISSSYISEIVTHTFEFDTVTPGNVGSIVFEYCDNSPLFSDPCTPPVGLDVSGASIDSQAGATGFGISGATTATNLVISRAPVAEVPMTNSYSFGNVINPSTPESVVYVRIAIYDNIDGTGAIVDQGSVVFVTENPFDVQAYVPPYLTFCVGVTVALDCSSTAGFLADFGEFSSVAAKTATTQLAAATNDPTGYNAFVSGQTMTSGSNTIPNLTTQTASQPGLSQFGLNLRANTVPAVGANPNAGPVASGSVAANYNTPNQFRFVSGDRIAGAAISTGFNRYTVSYLVNVSGSQNPGLYAATLTYTAIASF